MVYMERKVWIRELEGALDGKGLRKILKRKAESTFLMSIYYILLRNYGTQIINYERRLRIFI